MYAGVKTCFANGRRRRMDDGRTDDDGRTTTTDGRTDGRVNERTTDDGRPDKTTTDERTTTTEGRTDAGRPIFPWGQNPGIPLSRAESFTGFWLAANHAKLNPKSFRGVYMNMKPLNRHKFLQIVF